MKGFTLRFFTLSLFILIASQPPAVAQSGEAKSGLLNAFVCEALPPSAVLDVEMLDDAPRYQQLRKKFADQLKKDGIDVKDGASLVLTIDLRTIRDSQSSDRRGLGELKLGKGGSVNLRGKLWSKKMATNASCWSVCSEPIICSPMPSEF